MPRSVAPHYDRLCRYARRAEARQVLRNCQDFEHAYPDDPRAEFAHEIARITLDLELSEP